MRKALLANAFVGNERSRTGYRHVHIDHGSLLVLMGVKIIRVEYRKIVREKGKECVLPMLLVFLVN